MAESPSRVHSDHSFAINLMQDLVVPTFVLDGECRVLIWNRACERLTGVLAMDIIGTQEHWRAFYDEPRPCLADLIALGRTDEIGSLYSFSDSAVDSEYGIHAENWCVMPQLGSEHYLAIDAGAIYDGDGRLIAVVETLRDMTDHKRAQIALEHLAARDGLTGVANRRSFDEKLRLEWLRGKREGQAVSLMMMDVDHFKRFNDTYGHQLGDDCLRRVAESAATLIFRPGDMLARYGGEEFAVILPGVDLPGAMIVADRVRDAVSRMAIPHGESEMGHVTLSIGVSSAVPEDPVECDALVKAADIALYKAKNLGRNQVVAEVVAQHEEAPRPKTSVR